MIGWSVFHSGKQVLPICIFRWNNKLSRLEPEAIVTLGTLYDALRFLLAFRDD